MLLFPVEQTPPGTSDRNNFLDCHHEKWQVSDDKKWLKVPNWGICAGTPTLCAVQVNHISAPRLLELMTVEWQLQRNCNFSWIMIWNVAKSLQKNGWLRVQLSVLEVEVSVRLNLSWVISLEIYLAREEAEKKRDERVYRTERRFLFICLFVFIKFYPIFFLRTGISGEEQDKKVTRTLYQAQ